jgi:hypothetical protein
VKTVHWVDVEDIVVRPPVDPSRDPGAVQQARDDLEWELRRLADAKERVQRAREALECALMVNP